MKGIIFLLLLLCPVLLQAQIYRCDTDEGVVFSDQPCASDAEIIVVEEGSSGISMGPSEEVRDYLSDKRDERAEDREKRLADIAAAPKPQPPQVITVERPAYFPGYWWGSRPPQRPVQPIAPVPTPPSVIRPIN